jgi:hypothetical protein
MVQGCRFLPFRLFLERWMRRLPTGLTTLLSRDFAHSKKSDAVPILSLMVIWVEQIHLRAADSELRRLLGRVGERQPFEGRLLAIDW